MVQGVKFLFFPSFWSVRVKGMNLRNVMWHGSRNDIIMGYVVYTQWLKEINWTERCTFFGAGQFAKAATFLMLLPRLRWQSKSHEGFLAFSLSISFFRTATKILPTFISRAAWRYRYYIGKSTIEEKMFWKVRLPSALIFLQKMFARLRSQVFYLYL